MAPKLKRIQKIQEGNYILISHKGLPYEVQDYQSTNGTAEIKAKGVFSNDDVVELQLDLNDQIRVPSVEEREGQIVNIGNNEEVIIMDIENYDTFEISTPVAEGLSSGDTINYIQYENSGSFYRKIVRPDRPESSKNIPTKNISNKESEFSTKVYSSDNTNSDVPQSNSPNYCSGCGTELMKPNEIRYCPHCGSEIGPS
ncbi:hypothetical protein [Halorubrum ezzemoulense]|uniref:hypothetical protein n=1 Tax=Halorubrum ezzemoulense TaxID=337243 RepID=UPI00111BE721|nr:hypothetical protein [Halorubrum ezzemoulense]